MTIISYETWYSKWEDKLGEDFNACFGDCPEEDRPDFETWTHEMYEAFLNSLQEVG